MHRFEVRPWLAAAFLGMLLHASVGSISPPEAPKLADIASIESFKARFNADAGTVRLVLLLSPT